MSNPTEGGRYVRNPKTGALTRVTQSVTDAKTDSEPQADVTTETTTDAVDTASIRKGK